MNIMHFLTLKSRMILPTILAREPILIFLLSSSTRIVLGLLSPSFIGSVITITILYGIQVSDLAGG
jgi:hypothetical protein